MHWQGEGEIWRHCTRLVSIANAEPTWEDVLPPGRECRLGAWVPTLHAFTLLPLTHSKKNRSPIATRTPGHGVPVPVAFKKLRQVSRRPNRAQINTTVVPYIRDQIVAQRLGQILKVLVVHEHCQGPKRHRILLRLYETEIRS